jgi:hypothetical protein
LRLVALAIIAGVVLSLPEVTLADDPSRINGYVLPYYDPTGPIVEVGAYSGGLASPSQSAFVSTIRKMKKRWSHLNFPELYVAAIGLYDRGYRDEATYWFYSASIRGASSHCSSIDGSSEASAIRRSSPIRPRIPSSSSPGGEINGYAFGDISSVAAEFANVSSRPLPGGLK